jgi:hypothetical protein
MSEKKLESFRLSLFARSILQALADADATTKTALLERMIRQEAKRKKITLPE